MKIREKVTKVSILIALALLTINCGSGNNNPTATPYPPGFVTNTGAYSGYSLSATGQCISTSTGQIAPSPIYCTAGGLGTTGLTGYGTTGLAGYGSPYGSMGGSMSGICYGMYQAMSGNTGPCYGSPDNCAGYTLMSLSTGQVQYCM